MVQSKGENKKAVSYVVTNKKIIKWLNNQQNRTQSLTLLIRLAIKQFGYKDLSELSLDIATEHMNLIETPEAKNVPSNGTKTSPEEVEEKNIIQDKYDKKEQENSSEETSKEDSSDPKPVKRKSLLSEGGLS